jgi:hypothetical protein
MISNIQVEGFTCSGIGLTYQKHDGWALEASGWKVGFRESSYPRSLLEELDQTLAVLSQLAEEDSLATTTKQQQRIEGVEDSSRWLMDGANDATATSSDSPNVANQCLGSSRVQSVVGRANQSEMYR